ncbi:glycine receptor subunit alpha-3-like [Penaeus indicus]|uniref:glycine receptor subunit alpha-3-like n=1 Tax=Penaeus indicus TaxID=29960 RepID=UPI00300CC692
MELLMTWLDERLIPPANITDDEDFVSLHPSLSKKLWIPDIYFGHIRYMYAPRVFADAQEIWLHKNKSVGISKLLIVKTGCHMNFALYPMDIQRCLLSIESSTQSRPKSTITPTDGYTVDEMAYEWATWADKVKVLGETTLEQFSYNAIVTNLTSKVYGGDTYPRLGVEIVLERKLAYHLLQTYLPGSLFVMMSWFSFAVPPLVVPGRVVLCVTTILTLTSMFSTARTSTPQVSYIKALDVFMITSIIFVFLTLLEYTFLLRKRRQHLLEAAIKERTSNRRRWVNRKVRFSREKWAPVESVREFLLELLSSRNYRKTVPKMA